MRLRRSEGSRGEQGIPIVGACFEEAEEAQNKGFSTVEYIHREHRYFLLSLEDLLSIGSVSMSGVPCSISSFMFDIPNSCNIACHVLIWSSKCGVYTSVVWYGYFHRCNE